MRFPTTPREPAAPDPPRRRHPLRVILAALLAVCAVCLVSFARADVTTVFSYTLTNGGMPISSSLQQKFNQYGDTNVLVGSGAPNAWFVTHKVTGSMPPQDDFGAFYYKTPVDMTQGFQTKFLMEDVSGGFSLIIKNPSTSAHLLGGQFGYDGMQKAVAVTFDRIDNITRLSIPGAAGDLEWLNDFVSVNYDPQVNPNNFEQYGEVLIRYIPAAKLLDVYHWQPNAGAPTLVLRATDFDLSKYGVLDGNGAAEIGIIGRAYQAVPSVIPEVRMDTWEVGSNIQFSGITSTAYTELMTFKTSQQPVWGSNGKLEWKKSFGSSGQKPFDVSSFSPSDTKLFGAGAKGNVIWNDGLDFEASADGGLVDICYPLKLRIAFPLQRSVPVGQEIPLVASFEPDYGATMTASSPKASFRSYFNFKNNIDSSYFVRLPALGDLTTPILKANTNVDHVKFIDTDFIWAHKDDFGLAAGLGGGLVSLQDDEGANGKKSNERGEKGKGTTKGAKKGELPTDFVSLNLQAPSLDVNGGLSLSSSGGLSPSLAGGASSKFIGLHADFTQALMDLSGLGEILPINEDFQYKDYGVGWHIADFYGDVDLGVNVNYQFTPKPMLRLYVNDGTTTYFVDTQLHDDGSPVEIHGIHMPDHTLVFTPVVYMYDPNATGSGSWLNTFSPTAGLTLGGSLGFNPFQIYVNVPPDLALDTQSNPPVIQPLTLPLGDPVQLVTTPPAPFQLGGFNNVTGKPYTLFPPRSKNPIINSVTPDTSAIHSPAESGTTLVTLDCEGADQDVAVVWNDDPSQAVVPDNRRLPCQRVSSTQVTASIPWGLLTSRSVNTLTLINGIDEPNAAFRSNAVTFSAVPDVPALSNLAPSTITLSDPPKDGNGSTFLSTDTDNTVFFTLTVTGSQFYPGVTLPNGNILTGTVLLWNGKALPTTYVAGNKLTAKVPGSYIAQPGLALITAATSAPGGGISNSLPVQIKNPAPSLSSLGQSVLGGSGKRTLNLTGSGFIPNSTVSVSNVAKSIATTVTYLSSKRLDVELDSTTMTDGTYFVSVTNPAPGGGTSSSLQLLVDKTAPATTAIYDGTSGANGWYTSNVTVKLTAQDMGSGGITTSYSVDNGAVQTYSQTFTVSGEGKHTVSYFSTDAAGNVEPTHTDAVNIDGTKPATVYSVTDSVNGGPVTVTLTATDATSGVSKTVYKIDGGSDQTYTAPFTVSGGGIHTVTFKSQDVAGNLEAVQSKTIVLDNVAPVTTASADPAANAAGWNHGNVTVTLQASDGANGSGVQSLTYKVDAASPVTVSGDTTTFTINTEGMHTVTYSAVDKAGNQEADHTLTVKLDKTAPTTQLSADPAANAKGWNQGEVTLTLTATDALSGVAATYYTVDNGAQQTYTGAVKVSGDGVHTVTFWSQDNADNIETAQNLTLNIDGTAPVTAAATDPAANAAGWNQGSVGVTLTPTDGGSGIATTYYTVDGGAQKEYAGRFTVSGDGTHTVTFWSVDLAGNTEAARKLTVRIDGTAPNTTAAGDPAANAKGWNQGDVTVTLTAADATSGVASTYYTVDGGAQQTYTGGFKVSGEGKHTVTFWSQDQAGNTEAAQSLTLQIDGTAPVTSASPAPTANTSGWNAGPVTVTLAATDNRSGVAGTFYTVDGGAQLEYTAPFTVSGDKVHTVTFWSVDVASNVESANSLTVRIDTTSPSVTASADRTELWPPNGKMVPVTVTGKLTDGLSGIAGATVTYRVTDEYGSVQPSGSVRVNQDGTFAFTVQLEASRKGQDKDGRLYTIEVQAPDAAGNAGSIKLTVVVPHDQGK